MMVTNRMYAFDVDGVMTNPSNNVVSLRVLKHVESAVRSGEIIAFNTGRPFEWVQDNIIVRLQSSLTPQQLGRVLLVAEMGGVVCTYRGGKLHLKLDADLSLPRAFVQDVKRLINQQSGGHVYSDYVWWDSLKRTMGSLAKRDHLTLHQFEQVRPSLTADVQALMDKHKLDDFIIGQTTIALDIQHKTAGKRKGAQKILQWLRQNLVQSKTFYAFGDSVSDKDMAEVFATTGAKTIFVFLGDITRGEEVKGRAYKTVLMNGRHSTDTAIYLDSIKA